MKDLFFNKKILYLIPVIFLLIIILKISYAYYDLQEKQYDFALKKAELLNLNSLAYRKYYQKLFINGSISLNEDTIALLPAHSASRISDIFSQNNKFHISIKTVSDRARNPDNEADKNELIAIEYFKKNPQSTQYFNDKHDTFYQFAYPLRINTSCLLCHGKKEDAPEFIQRNYDDAYDYKIGEVRGIQSIKIPKDILNSYFMEIFIYSILYDILLLLLLFIAIFALIKKSKAINEYLSKQVKIKTQDLQKSLIIDGLTNIPNRLQLLEDLQKEKNSKSTHIALINIDGFKAINDFYGYKSGDVVIQKVSEAIKSICVHADSFLYKLPSDEFAIFTTRKMTEKEFFLIIKDVMKILHNTKIDTPNHSINVSLSAGISSNNEFLLPRANMALRVAKKGTNNIVIYDESINDSKNTENNIKGLNLIKNAFLRDAIVPFFQPIYNVHTQKIEKYEALVRIIQEDGTVLAPFHFLDIAIKSKLYPDITKIMIEKSFAFFIDKEYEFSINLSVDDIKNALTKKFILSKLEQFPHPQRIVFEILESDKVEDYHDLKEFIAEIKKYGCKFAIDDFGSGYSNFSHVLELNVDYLKIDASLVKYITTDESSRVITKTIINFASTLGLKTIAEFVEDKESLETLEKMGVDYIQGYYIGKPDKNLNTTFE